MTNYQISSWPTLIIDGKYVTSPPQAASRTPAVSEVEAGQIMLRMMDDLVDMAAKKRH
jgi:thiol:disulfide interchange protein DsbA